MFLHIFTLTQKVLFERPRLIWELRFLPFMEIGAIPNSINKFHISENITYEECGKLNRILKFSVNEILRKPEFFLKYFHLLQPILSVNLVDSDNWVREFGLLGRKNLLKFSFYCKLSHKFSQIFFIVLRYYSGGLLRRKWKIIN